MPFQADYNQIFLNSLPYIVVPGRYSVDELPYFAEQGREDQPSFSAYVPEVPTYWPTWHHGYGALYLKPDTTMQYYTAKGLDASVKSQLTLAAAFGTTGVAGTVSIGENIVDWKEMLGTLYAVGSQNVFQWDPTASPNGWTIALGVGTGGGPIGKAAVFVVKVTSSTSTYPGGPHLYVPTGSQYWSRAATGSWTRFASAASHFEVVDNNLWCVFYDAGAKTWKIQNSADGLNFAPPNTYNPVSSGVPTVTWLLNYDNRLEIFSTEGMSTIDGSANVIDLMPEMGKYGDFQVGVGANTYHGQAFLPSNFGMLQYYGSNVLNPNTVVSARSIGPDQSSWSQSDVRGKFTSVAPHVNYLYGAINSQAGNGSVLKFQDFDDLTPGQGWHPIQTFANSRVGAVKVSALPWYGSSYPILWTSAGSGNFNIYQTRLPLENDNPLLDSNVRYTPTGTLDLPTVDDDMPTLQKEYIKFVADVSVPSGTSIQMLAAIDGSAFSPIGALVTGTTGIVEWDFNTSGTYGYKIIPRIQMTASTTGVTATQTPVMRSLVLHHYVRPLRRRYWQIDLLAQDDISPNNGQIAKQQIMALDQARQTVAPVVFQDLFGLGSLATVEKFTYQQSERLAGKGVQWIAHIELQDYPITNFFTMSAMTMFSFAQ